MPGYNRIADPTRDGQFQTWVFEDVQIRKAVRLEDDMDINKAANLLATRTAIPDFNLPTPKHMTGATAAHIAQHRNADKEHTAHRPELGLSLLNEHEKERLVLLEQQRLEESFVRKAKEREMKKREIIEKEKQRLEWERQQEQRQERLRELERKREIERVVQETIEKLEVEKQKEKATRERAARWEEMERERVAAQQAARETELKMAQKKEWEAKRVQELEDAAFSKALQASMLEAAKEKLKRQGVEAAKERMQREAEAKAQHNRMRQRVTGTEDGGWMRGGLGGKMGGLDWNAAPQATRVPEIRAFMDDRRTGVVYPPPAATYPTVPANDKHRPLRPLVGPTWHNHTPQARTGSSLPGHGIEFDIRNLAPWDATAELDRLGETEAEIWRNTTEDSHTWQETITERRETVTRRTQPKDGFWR